MYWYYKYPLYAVGLLVIFGLLYLIWARVRPPEELAPAPPGVEQPVDEPVTRREPPLETEPPPPPPPPAPTVEIERRLAAAEEQLEKEQLVAARTLALKVLDDVAVKRFDPNWSRAAAVITTANTVLLNSSTPAPEKTAYIVQDGDSLSKIASHHRSSVGAIQRLNDLNPADSIIYPGNVLHVLQCKWEIIIDKSRFALLLMADEKLCKLYRVGIGRQDRTPVGVFEITNKIREPVWSPPGKTIPYGHAENVLGTHWLGLVPVEGTDTALTGYGIHGTWEPDSIGAAASQGCVRMHNADVAELFDLVPVKTRVTIRDE